MTASPSRVRDAGRASPAPQAWTDHRHRRLSQPERRPSPRALHRATASIRTRCRWGRCKCPWRDVRYAGTGTGGEIMGDWFQTIVDTEATSGEAQGLAANVLDWLIAD